MDCRRRHRGFAQCLWDTRLVVARAPTGSPSSDVSIPLPDSAERRELAETGFPRGSPQAHFGRQGHRAEGQLPDAASYSHWRPTAVCDERPLEGGLVRLSRLAPTALVRLDNAPANHSVASARAIFGLCRWMRGSNARGTGRGATASASSKMQVRSRVCSGDGWPSCSSVRRISSSVTRKHGPDERTAAASALPAWPRRRGPEKRSPLRQARRPLGGLKAVRPATRAGPSAAGAGCACRWRRRSRSSTPVRSPALPARRRRPAARRTTPTE
jgi:hypothetical protein